MADYTKGCDEVPAKLFKSIFDILGDAILDMCNCSLVKGTFPDALMIAKIICLFVQSKESSIMRKIIDQYPFLM